MEKVKRYDTVKVHYNMSVDGRGVVESTENGEPLQFTLSAGHVIPGLERAVKGMTVGQTKTVLVSPEEGYGEYDDSLLIKVPKCNLPDLSALKAGMILQAGDQPVTIREVLNDGAMVDLNAPYAGEYLSFEVTVIDIIPKPKSTRTTKKQTTKV